MAVRSKRLVIKKPRGQKKGKRQRMFTLLSRFIRESWRAVRAMIKSLMAAPPLIRAIVLPTLLLILWFGVNWTYHTVNKPTEVFFPLKDTLKKHPMETWKQYESLFREHATVIITPEFLAALAQVESAGNPVAQTYWRWKLTWNPLEWYQPASSAVGMFQITDGTFTEAKHYCIHNHKAVEDGPWHELQACWFNSLYTRVIPSHAIELTAALLDRQVTELLIGTGRFKTTPLHQKQDLAAVLHLCGAGAGRAYAKGGLRLRPHQRCGDHNVSAYLARIKALKHRFSKSVASNQIIQQAH